MYTISGPIEVNALFYIMAILSAAAGVIGVFAYNAESKDYVVAQSVEQPTQE